MCCIIGTDQLCSHCMEVQGDETALRGKDFMGQPFLCAQILGKHGALEQLGVESNRVLHLGSGLGSHSLCLLSAGGGVFYHLFPEEQHCVSIVLMLCWVAQSRVALETVNLQPDLFMLLSFTFLTCSCAPALERWDRFCCLTVLLMGFQLEG